MSSAVDSLLKAVKQKRATLSETESTSLREYFKTSFSRLSTKVELGFFYFLESAARASVFSLENIHRTKVTQYTVPH